MGCFLSPDDEVVRPDAILKAFQQAHPCEIVDQVFGRHAAPLAVASALDRS